MTAERWQRAAEVFHSALDQPPSSWEQFLRSACEGDEELYREVHAMLHEHSRTGWLDRPPWEAFAGEAVFAEGQVVAGRYRVMRFVGRGGMGEVYEAEDLELKERVALKTLLPAIAGNARMIGRFKQEIQLSRRVAHPNVCRVFDLARHPADGSQAETVVFLTMEFLDGETLAARLEREGKLGAEAALPVLEQIADALDAAHRSGVIHRDLKPSNVMLTPRAVVTDFGLARTLAVSSETTASLTGEPMGTLDYMAPELLTGNVATVESDIYALGMVAFKMVTGALPFSGKTPMAAAILRSKAPLPPPRSIVPDLDPAWERAILRALDANPARRFASARDFVRAVRGETGAVTVVLPAMTRWRWIAAVLAIAAVIGGVLAWRAWERYREQPPAEAMMYYRQGVDDIHAGAYFAATKALEQAVRIAPKFSLAHARLAEAWNELDVTEKASQEMLLARRQDSSRLSRLDRLQMEAIDLTITREFDAAVSRYQEMLPLVVPGDVAVYVDLGRAYERASKPSKAADEYRRAADSPWRDPAAWLLLGGLYWRASNWPKADEAFQQAAELYQITSNLEGLTEVAFQRGIAANSRGLLLEAAKYLHQAFETASAVNNVHQEIRAELQLGTNAYLSGDNVAAERYARMAIDNAQASQMEPLVIRGLVNLGAAYYRKRDFVPAEKYFTDALSLARRNNLRRLAALVLISLAALHDQLNRSADTANEAQEALSFYQPNRFGRETLQCLTLLGRAEENRGNYTVAQSWFEKSLDLAEKSQDQLQMALAHESLGGIYQAQEQYPRALEHYRSSLQLSTDLERAGYANLQCGDMLWRLGRYTEAHVMFDAAEKAAEKFPLLRLRLEKARAEMALSLNNYTEAFHKARRAFSQDGSQDPLAQAMLLRVIGLAELGSGAKLDGLRRCEEALTAAVKLDEVSVLLDAQLAVAQADLETGGRAAAFAMLREADAALKTHPESRWRSLALLATVDHSYLTPAREALNQLAGEWGADALRLYLTRSDIQKLMWPLTRAFSAKK